MASPFQDKRPPRKLKVVTVKFADSEYDSVARKARELRIPFATYVRAVALDSTDDESGVLSDITRVTQEPAFDIRPFVTELNRVGVNINQIARQCNTDDANTVLSENAESVVAWLRHVKSLLGAFHQEYQTGRRAA